jgi:hypothetical protein
MRVLGGVFAVVLGAVAGGVLGGAVGHLAGGGDKNVGLGAALYGLTAGAVAAVGVLAWRSRRTRDWRPFLGGAVGFALGAGALAWLIGRRVP